LPNKANVPVLASAAKQSSATVPEERSRFRSVRDRFLDCLVALLPAMTAEKTSSAACQPPSPVGEGRSLPHAPFIAASYISAT
jgi:hypothetical protein